MKRPLIPKIEEFLKTGTLQRISFRMPLPQSYRRVAHKDTWRSPRSVLLDIRELTLRKFIVVPAQANTAQELVFFPKHGYAEIFIWRDGAKDRPEKFKLNMGERPVAVPPGCAYALMTFATRVRLHVIACPLRPAKSMRNRVLWQHNAQKLCENKH